jgi:2,4-dienoyl-CoA reductase-like NADH-dependent reductase (Old Yellow Enzyme family)
MTDKGFVTERLIRFLEERARGGVGLITVEEGIVDSPVGNNSKNALAIDDDKYLPMLQELTRRIKAHGAKIALQISHAGRRAGRVSKKTGCLEVSHGHVPVAPLKIILYTSRQSGIDRL